MRLLMAVSMDGYTASHAADDMRWTGHADKRLFKSLTSVDGVCAVGKASWPHLPKLGGRRTVWKVVRAYSDLSRTVEDPQEFTLADLYEMERTSGMRVWLIGGATVALAAAQAGFLDEVHLCRVLYRLNEAVDEESRALRATQLAPWRERVHGLVKYDPAWRHCCTTQYEGMSHEVYRRGP